MSTANYETIKSQAEANLVAITENPKPSYNIDGQRFSHGEYLEHLTDLIDWCDRKIAAAAPFEIRTQHPQP